jgi:hypothetical protein
VGQGEDSGVRAEGGLYDGTPAIRHTLRVERKRVRTDGPQDSDWRAEMLIVGEHGAGVPSTRTLYVRPVLRPPFLVRFLLHYHEPSVWSSRLLRNNGTYDAGNVASHSGRQQRRRATTMSLNAAFD